MSKIFAEDLMWRPDFVLLARYRRLALPEFIRGVLIMFLQEKTPTPVVGERAVFCVGLERLPWYSLSASPTR